MEDNPIINTHDKVSDISNTQWYYESSLWAKSPKKQSIGVYF